jgi:hypothetical protein
VSYLAAEQAFERDVQAFWTAAHSMRPFRGQRLAPTAPSPLATLYSD